LHCIAICTQGRCSKWMGVTNELGFVKCLKRRVVKDLRANDIVGGSLKLNRGSSFHVPPTTYGCLPSLPMVLSQSPHRTKIPTDLWTPHRHTTSHRHLHHNHFPSLRTRCTFISAICPQQGADTPRFSVFPRAVALAFL